MTTTLAATNPQDTRVGDEQRSEGGGSISQVVSFRLANEEYGLDIMKVQEIILMGEITEIPEVPPYIRGLINFRGKVIPVVDLRKRFRLQAADSSEQTRIIVVNADENIFGIVVDAVSEVLRVDAGQIESPPAGLVGLDRAYIKGLVKMDNKIMILLNIDRILSHDDRAGVAGSGQQSIGDIEGAVPKGPTQD